MAPPNDRKRRIQDTENSAATKSHDPDGGIARTTKKAKVDDGRSVFVRSLPPGVTNESLTDFFSQYFAVKHATVVVDQETKESRGFGFVSFADADDARDAKAALDKKEWDGRRIRIEVAEPRQRNADEASKRPGKGREAFQRPSTKLIIRNLPWSIKTSEQLSKLFLSYGKVIYSDLPQDKGKLKGFGFVTIRGRPNAEKALEAVNGKIVDGRPLAVDWAVDKATWDKQQGTGNGKKDSPDDDDEEEEEEEEKAKDEKKDKDVGDDGEVKNRDDQLASDLANFMKNHMTNMEDEDDKDEDEDEDDEDDDEDMKLVDEMDEEKETQKPKRELMTDNSSTVFVRNLPFTATDEQLKSFFGHFGTIRYARVVMDKATDRPAGTGFVCFVDNEDAKSCIINAPRREPPTAGGVKHSILQDENADPTGKYTMDGRVLQVAQAVNKNEAANLAENSLAQRRQKDKRHLYLLSEGAIGNSPLRGLLTDAEVRMRSMSAQQRKKLVEKNPMLHISLTRLALRNIPNDIGPKELKELARKAVVEFAKDVKEGRRQPPSKEENARDGKDAKDKEKDRKQKRKGIVKQAKIVFEDNKGSKVSESSGAGKSRGYGFIEYTSHRHALMGLRYLNGHQLDGNNGRKQRLIVEFAIENAQVVKRRQEAEKTARKPKKEGDADASDDEEDEEDVPEQKQKKQKGKKPKGNLNKGPQVGAKVKPPKEGDVDEKKKPVDAKEAIQQKVIARKRQVRKKKAVARGRA